ncbi:MAG: hypothetical protein ED559_02120 [Phycisphaera sp.]|nr:MAG: hypothetical protein ED559_02120 [Phycisphaera sp.]
MIDRLTGRLESIEGAEAVLVPEGSPLAYAALLPAYLAERLAGSVGQEIRLHTHLILESQNQGATFTPRLIGFGSPTERAFFMLFTTVKGVGSRKALRAMAAEPAEIARAIAAHDTKTLTKLPEIGKRLAETVVAELSGKVEKYLSTDDLDRALAEAGSRAMGGTLDGEAKKAHAALLALGETPTDAEQMIRRALAMEPKPSSSDELIKAAYQVGRG